ncbi:hypothetical protein COOONC_21032 [Cooperia oncophora]
MMKKAIKKCLDFRITRILEFIPPGSLLLLERVRKGKDATGASLMRWLRNRRYGAIQKGIQFVFLHRLTIEMLCEEGVKKKSDEKVVKFDGEYQKLLTKQRRILATVMEQKAKLLPAPKPTPAKSAASEMEVLQTQMDDDEDRKVKSLDTAEELTKAVEDKVTSQVTMVECFNEKEDLPFSDYAEFL